MSHGAGPVVMIKATTRTTIRATTRTMMTAGLTTALVPTQFKSTAMLTVTKIRRGALKL